jgi:uncharacterized protein involved in type VI secretion and phage assembly
MTGNNPPSSVDIGQVSIKLNGTLELALEQDNLLDVVIEQDLFLPDALTLRVADVLDQPALSATGYYTLLDQDKFQIGASIEVGIGHERPEKIFGGEITSVELEVGASGYPMLIVRAFDKSHRLRRQRKTRAFVNVTDNDIARQVASGCGLTFSGQSTSEVYTHVFQDNQTDWDFLRARAARIGHDVFVRNNSLHFQPMGHDTTVITVTHGEDLHRVRVRLSAQGQVDTVTVRGWDPAQKEAVVATANSARHNARVGEAKTGSQLAHTFGSGSFVLADRVITSQDEATSRAKAIYDSINAELYQVDGACYGNPSLRPGCTIELKNIGQRYSGRYYVSAVTHRRRRGEAYVASFVVNGRRASTLSATLSQSPGTHANDGPAVHPAVVVAVVTDVKDPEHLGRVKLKFPWLDGGTSNGAEGVASNWARIASPMAGADRGFIWLPEVNDEVLAAFEHGDINRPYVLGSLWNGRDKPPGPTDATNKPLDLVAATGKVDRRLIKTRTGHTVLLDDSETSPQVVVKTKAGHSLTLDDTAQSPSVTVKSSAGHSVKLDDSASSAGVTVSDKNNNSVKIDSATNAMTIKCTGNMTIEASGTLTIKGTTVTIEANTAFTLKGNASGTVESSGVLNVKGSLVKIN